MLVQLQVCGEEKGTAIVLSYQTTKLKKSTNVAISFLIRYLTTTQFETDANFTITFKAFFGSDFKMIIIRNMLSIIHNNFFIYI